jgi:hypothetical protein
MRSQERLARPSQKNMAVQLCCLTTRWRITSEAIDTEHGCCHSNQDTLLMRVGIRPKLLASLLMHRCVQTMPSTLLLIAWCLVA